ncbi:MAG: type I-E CRISPR-associated protein Cas7/Cse4/CasC [Acidobacteriia bacterium]|nr:type I-E CRISPR-associated protein Cas7/Cse4/CasC [Terriglobia bacterium]
MSRFLQLHFLTIYPLSNPNRDDLGRPKMVNYGGVPMLRISSQALKRAARLSDVMQAELKGHLGERTQRIGEVVRDTLAESCEVEAERVKIAEKVADIFGKLDAQAAKQGAIRTRQLAFISPDERAAAIELARKALTGESLPKDKELKKMVLRTADGAVDVAMFGRMLADDPVFNREAAVQVSHALTTHRALVEDDYYTAVDDLKLPAEDSGAGFVGEAGFGSGVFYAYACVDTRLLIENLGGDRQLAARAAGALVEALATATPSGKRNSFAHQTRASYIRAESGDSQPRSLAGAFFKPVEGQDLTAASVDALEEMAAKMDTSYGACAETTETMNVAEGKGTMAAVRTFAADAVTND